MRIGYHINKDGEKTYGPAAASLMEIVGKNCATQIFVTVPRHSTPIQFTNDALVKYAENGLRVYVHSNYITHIHSRDSALPLVMNQLKIADQYGFYGLVLHLTNVGYNEILQAIVKLLNGRELSKYKPLLIFEIHPVMASKCDHKLPRDSANFDQPEKLTALIEDLTARGFSQQDFKICIDTAHLWSYGVNVRMEPDMKKWFTAIDPKWISLIHFNDSASPLGGQDVHAVVGLGTIWPLPADVRFDYCLLEDKIRDHAVEEHRRPGFLWLLRYAYDNNIDVVLERSSQSIEICKKEMMATVNLVKRWNEKPN